MKRSKHDLQSKASGTYLRSDDCKGTLKYKDGMISYDSLPEAIRRSGVTNKELASRFGVTSQAVSQWKIGKLPSSEKIQSVMAFLTERIAQQEGTASVEADQPTVTQNTLPGYVPIRSLNVNVGAGGGGILSDGFLREPRFFEEDFVCRDLRARPENLFVVEIEGQSMEPLLRSGDTVLVDTRRTNIAMEGIFVIFDGDGIVCKWVELVRSSEVPMLRIKSENSRFPSYEVEADRCQVLGRVVWFSRRM